MMNSKTIMLVAAVMLAVALMFAFADTAAAQADDQVTGDTDELKSTDNNLSQKRGINQSLANRPLGGEDEEGEAKGPTKFQMGLGFGSCIVMIIVVKWL